MSVEIGAMLATAKAAAVVVRAAGNIELYQQILDLQQNMLDALGDNTRLAATNAKLSRNIIELQRQLDAATQRLSLRAKMKYKNGVYWNAEGDEAGGIVKSCGSG